MQRLSVILNGLPVDAMVEDHVLLVQWLRDAQGMTGTHQGCDTSQCGACTVLVDGEAVKSCNLLAVQVDGSAITTIEGLGAQGQRQPCAHGHKPLRR